jgi:hypothetical protein
MGITNLVASILVIIASAYTIFYWINDGKNFMSQFTGLNSFVQSAIFLAIGVIIIAMLGCAVAVLYGELRPRTPL